MIPISVVVSPVRCPRSSARIYTVLALSCLLYTRSVRVATRPRNNKPRGRAEPTRASLRREKERSSKERQVHRTAFSFRDVATTLPRFFLIFLPLPRPGGTDSTVRPMLHFFLPSGNRRESRTVRRDGEESAISGGRLPDFKGLRGVPEGN